MQSLPDIVTLVPQSGVQFIDLRFNIEALDKDTRQFWEQPLPEGQAYDPRGVLVNLKTLQRDEDGSWIDPATGQQPGEDETYPISRPKAFEAFLNQWIPLPYLRVEDAAAKADDVRQLGPTNWARIRVVPLPEPDEDGNTHAVVLAFDTALRESRMSPFPSLSPEDSRRGATFAMAAARDAIAWFLNQEWLASWLREVILDFLRRGWKGKGEPPQGRPCEHFARYLAFLEILHDARLLPAVKLIDVVSDTVPYQPIGVDLVLDIGNSRTCGVLVEHGSGGGLNSGGLNNSFPLQLRDIERPHLVYARPFESRVEFAIASFGRDALARRSGAAGFQWPSPIRVGPEAMRLAAAARGNQGATGLSSPKRYLWDERPTTQVWRANGIDPTDGVTVEPPVTGSFMRHVSQEGEVLRAKRRGRRSDLAPAQRAHFSRSSLMTFLLTEVLMHAVSQINAVQSRYARSFPEVPRRLARILLTMPPAMPLAEQRIFRDRAQAAARLAWDLLGWTQATGGHVPSEPRIVANLDEATATQLVFLYTEVSQRLRGDPNAFFELTGRRRPARYGDTPSLRIASIDIGGGTTDLMICTYVSRHGQEITPEQNFREGFRIAGDEVLRDVIESIVLPQLEQALAAAGTMDAKALLQQLLGGERGDQSELERHLQRQFVSQVLEAIGLAIIHAYELVTDRGTHEILRSTTGALLAGRLVEGPMAYVVRQAERAGARGFDPMAIEISARAEDVDKSVKQALGEALGFLCEVVHAFDCDWLLVSGRPSRLRAVVDTLVARLPVPPHRIVPMHNYVAGGWYPFRDPAGRIDDPKTTAAVGAMLSARAEGGLEGFLLRASQLGMRSTARYLGRMDLGGNLPRANVLLEDPDRVPGRAPGSLPGGNGAGDEVGFQVELRAPFSIGFRQLDLERWPVSRLYKLEYTNPDTVQRLRLPLRITVRRAEIDPEQRDTEELREEFKVLEVEDGDGDRQPPGIVTLRLQTEASEAGYWRDTGVLSVP
jgi:hypothetical protein